MQLLSVLVLLLVVVSSQGFNGRLRRSSRTSDTTSTSSNNRTSPLSSSKAGSWSPKQFNYPRPHGLLRKGVFWKSSTVVSASASSNEEHRPRTPLKIIIAGAPASGKGTQCEVIKEKFGVVHLSTGDILRAAVKEGTPLGRQAKAYMDAGKLVPDELIINVVCDRLRQDDCQCRGWLLDGFPRTRAQADALQKAGITADCFILLDVPEEVLVERVEGRRTDPVTGTIYHLKYKPPPEDPAIKSRLVQRSDDTAEKIKVRYRDFTSNIDSVRAVYDNVMIRVDGTRKSDAISQEITSALSHLSDNLDATDARRLVSPLKVIIAGAPASGKGTQCEVIKEKFGVVHLSTGDILRAAVKEGTPLGLQAKAYMDAGKLVPDELIINVVCDRLRQDDCQCRGWLLDGFPRTRAQADALQKAGITADCFILLDVPEEVLVERVEGRRTDPVTGTIYHLKYKPPPEDPAIKSRLVQRSDDTAEKIKVRYRDFTSNIDSVRAVYEDKLIRVDGTQKSADVGSAVTEALHNILSKKLPKK